jgi:hypothetical protein
MNKTMKPMTLGGVALMLTLGVMTVPTTTTTVNAEPGKGNGIGACVTDFIRSENYTTGTNPTTRCTTPVNE